MPNDETNIIIYQADRKHAVKLFRTVYLCEAILHDASDFLEWRVLNFAIFEIMERVHKRPPSVLHPVRY